MIRMRCLSSMIACLAIALPAHAEGGDSPARIKADKGSIFLPVKGTSLGALNVASGQTVTFDTGGKDRAPQVSEAITGKGQLGLSQSGKVEVAVFTFDSIQLAKGAIVKVVGDRGLVLNAAGGISIDATIDVSGSDGKRQDVKVDVPDGLVDPPAEVLKIRGGWGGYARRWLLSADGGPGAEGGERGLSFASNPSPPDGGNGAPPAKDAGYSGRGYGGGKGTRVKGSVPGGGAGYGGEGGASGRAAGHRPRGNMPGGPAYGDKELTELFGGSGGGGGCNDRGFTNGGGGGGGGAVSLVSQSAITIKQSGRLLANGGAGASWDASGGGGSGGGILLAAPAIDIADEAVISAAGGDGGKGGGGGAGGRIAVYSATPLLGRPKAVSVAGGTGAKPGGDGSFHADVFKALAADAHEQAP